jgi:hypothetical protein
MPISVLRKIILLSLCFFGLAALVMGDPCYVLFEWKISPSVCEKSVTEHSLALVQM